MSLTVDTDSKGTSRKGRLRGWILFVACLLLFSLGATSYHKMADSALIAVRLSLVIVLSVLVVRERWNNRDDRISPHNPRETILQRLKRWYYDEELNK